LILLGAWLLHHHPLTWLGLRRGGSLRLRLC